MTGTPRIQTAESRLNGVKTTITLDDKRQTSNHHNSVCPPQGKIKKIINQWHRQSLREVSQFVD
jgi:hypothetical protein